ncbi:hypothetical protein F4779DRAFT_621439 [Xylariaceae sp. FL0662B]|nr:hypothetical protein F4779DRAFT_621439 [Xylariaceae sp. FL0662B]
MGSPILTALLIYQLRGRMLDLAYLQERIPKDIEEFLRGGPAARDKFIETRDIYLDALNISKKQLRQAINSSELDGPANDDVEEIMAKVQPNTPKPKPLTREELEPHVRSGRIEESDIECIISAEFPTLEAYEEYLTNEVGSMSLGLTRTPSKNAEVNNKDVSGIYDKDGIYVENNEDKSDKSPHSGDAKGAEKLFNLDYFNILQMAPPESSSWADEVEEWEAFKSQTSLNYQKSGVQTLEQTPVQTTESSGSLAQDTRKIGGINQKRQNTDDPSPMGNKLDEQVGLARNDSVKSAHTRAVEEIEELRHAIEHVDFSRCSDDEDDDEEDDILETWIEARGQWYWQLEIVFAATLTKRRFKEEFQAARNAYKVDPWGQQE